MEYNISQKLMNTMSNRYSNAMDELTFKVINQAKAMQKDFVEKLIVAPANNAIKSMNATFEKVA